MRNRTRSAPIAVHGAIRLGSENSRVAKGIIFDGDDTLWTTEPLYDAARQRARALVEVAGLDGEAWESLERRIDVENVARFGHTPVRFPTSCVEAYEKLALRAQRPVNSEVADAIHSAAGTAFGASAPLVSGVRKTLQALRGRHYRLALMTKGDRGVQLRRIRSSGLEGFFDEVLVVDEKTPDSIAALLARLDVPPEAALSVGNSLRSDVMPALEAGVQPIWIDNHVWEYERSDDPPAEGVLKLERFADLLEVAR